MKPEEIKTAFLALQSRAELAKMLGTNDKNLCHLLYSGNRDDLYQEFTIKKKAGGVRTILAPNSELKAFQKKLKDILLHVYRARPSVHGFAKDSSILTNAREHKRRSSILNIDLEDFFPTINFGRVRGLFIAKPYGLPPEVATVLAQLCTTRGALPQGAPTSPIISNMICSSMDGELQEIARRFRCTYTRYADDITISTNLRSFPQSVAFISSGDLRVGNILEKSILDHGFRIKDQKSRLATGLNMAKIVTGLVVNDFVNVKRQYVRNVRSALHKWDKNGIEAAAEEFFVKYSSAEPSEKTKAFRNSIRGKINFICQVREFSQSDRKKGSGLYSKRFLEKYHINSLRDFNSHVIRTEGKTDWQHLVRAFAELQSRGKYPGKTLNFYRCHENEFYGDKVMKGFCEKVKNGAIRPFSNKVVCLFDCDEKEIIALHKGILKHWESNTVSLTLPSANGNRVCIESFYKKSDLEKTINGCRIFLSSEFDRETRLHLTKTGVKFTADKEKLNSVVIDDSVFDENQQKKVSLSKSAFANAIYQSRPPFDRVDFSGFEPIFDSLFEAIES